MDVRRPFETNPKLTHHGEDPELIELVLEHLTEGVAVVDTDFNFIEFNPVGKEIIGLGAIEAGPAAWAEQYGIFLEDEVTPYPVDKMPLVRAVRGETRNDIPVFIRNQYRPHGVHLHVSIRPLRNEDGEIKGGMAIFRDVTAQKHTLEALTASEERWRSLVENAPDFIFTMDLDYKIRFINRTLEGMTPEKVQGLSAFDFLEPHVALQVKEGLEKVRDSGENAEFEVRGRNPDGNYAWYNCRVSPIYKYRRVVGFTVIASDDTERRKNREELAEAYLEMEDRVAERTRELRLVNKELEASRDKLRSLNDRILEVQEEERRRIAREIHDVFGQALTSLKYDISWLTSRAKTDEVAEKLVKMDDIIDSTIRTVRRLSSDLRPGALDDLGLIAALEWQTKEFQTRTGIDCSLRSNVDDPTLTPEGAVAVFRVFQEALTNVMRHSKASEVDLSIEQNDKEVLLEVKDDGRGITDEELNSRKSLGLIGIRERVGHVGGQVEIGRRELHGSYVRVRIPIHKEND